MKKFRNGDVYQRSFNDPHTVKPVCNDHLYDKIYYL